MLGMERHVEQVTAMIRGFIAASLDGYVADINGGIDWLQPFEDVEYGYQQFIAEVSTVVLGRTTYDQIPGLTTGWPYPNKRGIVVTSKPLVAPWAGVEAWHAGVSALITYLGSLEQEDVWVVGGAKLLSEFVAAGALTRLDLFVIPVLLGEGVPLFPRRTASLQSLQLLQSRALERGMVQLTYKFTIPLHSSDVLPPRRG